MSSEHMENRKRAEAALSLSSGHISTGATVEYAAGGGYVKLRYVLGKAGEKRRRFKRGVVRGFSGGSRCRMMQKLASIDTNKVCKPMLITLTYPSEWPSEWQTWKDNLEAFRKALERKIGKCAVVWRQDLQKRGAPHFHLLVFYPGLLDMVWLMFTWWRIVGSKDPKHLVAGTHVKRVRSWRGMFSYAAHYLGKVTDESLRHSPMGRQWGVWHKSLLEIEMRSVLLTQAEFWKMRRAVWRYTDKRRPRRGRRPGWLGLWTFLSSESTERLLAYCMNSS